MTLEAPQYNLYPSARVRLAIRFDEFGEHAKVSAQAPDTKTPKLAGTSAKRNNLTVSPDPEAPPGVTRFILSSSKASTRGGGQGQTESQDGFTKYIEGVIPKDAQFNDNGIRAGNELTLTLRWSDFPIDPRTVRACAVEFFLGTLKPEDFAGGQRGGITEGSDGIPLNLIPKTYVDDKGRQRTNLRFQGWVDDYDLTWSDGEPVVKLKCRDNTALFINQEAPQQWNFEMKKPLDEAIATYLSQFPQLQDMTVEYRPTTASRDSIPKLGNVLAVGAAVPQLGPPVNKQGGGAEKANLWDRLTDICVVCGHTCRVDGTKVIIQRSSSLLNTKDTRQRTEDPYEIRNLESGRYENRTFIYGRNVSEFTIKRRFTKRAPTNVAVRSYNIGKKAPLVAYSPKTGAIAKANPGDGKVEQTYQTFIRNGIQDQDTLQAIADNLYNEIGRNEIEAKVKTHNLASFGGKENDPDILDMKAGDLFEVLVNRDKDFSTMTEVYDKLGSAARAQAFMQKLGFTEDFAKVYAQAYTAQGFPSTFIVKQISFSWDVDNGVSVEITGINFVEVRVDKTRPVGEQIGAR